MTLSGGIEAGGTKFVCGVGTGPEDLQSVKIPTTTATETIRSAIEFLRSRSSKGANISALGIASFGPIDLDPASRSFGFITTTPKAGWQNVDIVGECRRALGIPVGFDTDVNGAALAESRWGAAKGLTNVVYITVGTGIGGGALVGGRLVHGLIHPEMGHMTIPHDRSADPFEGCCPFHRDCLEGLASGTALAKRWGRPASSLPAEHPAWELEAEYLASGLINLICVISPQRLILGGGVMHNHALLVRTRQKVSERLNGYLQSPSILSDIESYIVNPLLGDRTGVLGAIALAQDASSPAADR